jgi:hypothetical protein
LKWPGSAAVVISVVHIVKGPATTDIYLNETKVARISAYLIGGTLDASPFSIQSNPYFSLGSKIYGQGFLFADGDDKSTPISAMEKILVEKPELQNRIIPYVGGEEINAEPAPCAKRFSIFLTDLQTEAEIAQYTPLSKIVEERVRPERMRLGENPNNIPLKRRWWAYQAHRPELYSLLKNSRFAICNSQVSKHLAFACYPPEYMFAHTACVIPASGLEVFSILQSRVHEIWARFFSSSMKDDLRYAPSDCFETFPFPPSYETDSVLEAVGQTYHDYRAALMVAANEGMTKTYNRFHKSDERSEPIRRLRELHDEIDRAVLVAYGWHDLGDELRPEFLTEETEDDHTYQGRYFWPPEARDLVLARLLALNAERHAEEVAAGLVPSGIRIRKDDEEKNEGQAGLDF